MRYNTSYQNCICPDVFGLETEKVASWVISGCGIHECIQFYNIFNIFQPHLGYACCVWNAQKMYRGENINTLKFFDTIFCPESHSSPKSKCYRRFAAGFCYFQVSQKNWLRRFAMGGLVLSPRYAFVMM